MRMVKSFFVLTGVFSFCIQAPSQTKLVADANRSVLVDESKPAVYLEFVKTGICNNGNYSAVIGVGPCEKKSDSDREFEAVWVRFVNNSRWALSVDVQKSNPLTSVPITLPNRASVTAAKDNSEIDVIYDLESETGCDFHIDVPPGQPCVRRETPLPEYDRHFFYSVIFIPSGQSILYAIDRAHLKKYITTYVNYHFEWEMGKNGWLSTPKYDSQHRVYFSRYDLESGIKREAKR